MNHPVRKAAVVTGIALLVLGVLLLFWTQNFINGLVRWWPAGITIIGAYFLYRAWFRKARPSVLFMGLLLFLTGAFMSALNAFSADPVTAMKDFWPAFMGIVGISLIPYGARYRRTIRVTLVVPGIILIVLAGVFLLFSLSIVKQSFSEFVISWWPLVLVFMGIILIGSGWVGRKE
jgi:hypothetical protein